MEYQVQVPVGNLPINMVLVGNKSIGKIAFVRMANFNPILEVNGEGAVWAIFSQDSFCIDAGEGMMSFNYDVLYDYKEMPEIVMWAKQQNLQQPY